MAADNMWVLTELAGPNPSESINGLAKEGLHL